MKKTTAKINTLFVFIIYALCGVLTALPCVNTQLWIFSWIFPTVVLYIEYNHTSDGKHPYISAYLRGFAFFYFYALIIFYWFVELYPLDFAGLTPLEAVGVVILAWFGIPILQSVPSAFMFVFLTLFKRKSFNLMLYPFLASALFVMCEYSHTLTWLGVPWGKLAVGQTGRLQNIQSASLLGSYFVSFLIICVSGFLTLALIHLLNKKNIKKSIICFTVAVLIFEANSIYGQLKIKYLENKEYETVTAAAIQANIASDEKWADEASYTFEKYKELTISAAKSGAKLIVWPETAFPYTFNSADWLTEYVCDIASYAEAELIIGTFNRDFDADKLYNVTRYVSPENGLDDTVYAKRRLVPFGEFVPMRDIIMKLFPPLSEISMLSSDLEEGTDSALFETKFGKIGSLICFDSIYEELARKSTLDGAELLAISTNDSWFHDSSAIYEHNAHAVLRSVENGRYTVRSANTGISSIITNTGKITSLKEPLVEGYAIGEVAFISDITPYTYLGNILVLISAIFVFITVLIYFIIDRKSKIGKNNGYNNL